MDEIVINLLIVYLIIKLKDIRAYFFLIILPKIFTTVDFPLDPVDDLTIIVAFEILDFL